MTRMKIHSKFMPEYLFSLGVCLFTMTTEILFVAFGEWVMGAIACKIIVYGQIVTLASATFLLTGMAIDRYALNFHWRKSNLYCNWKRLLEKEVGLRSFTVKISSSEKLQNSISTAGSRFSRLFICLFTSEGVVFYLPYRYNWIH